MIVVPPRVGRVKKNDVDEHRFSLRDVKEGLISYEHDPTTERSTDDFQFIVKV